MGPRSRFGWVVVGMGVWGVIAGGVSPALAAEEGPGRATHPVYRKPFLVEGRASVGGYMDLEFLAGESGSTFNQHRFVPFIFAEVSDRVHVASEIEFEYGGNPGEDGEIQIEFATVDFRVADPLNLRAGIVLSPLGRLNAFHDAPALDLTDRPLVDRFIVPTTLSEAGLGFYGSFLPTEAMAIDYEAYLVNGFDGDAVADGELALRDARGSKKLDNNNSRALVGRLGLSPRLGTDFGVSVHTGDYDDAGEHRLTVAALDARFAAGPVEILGEGALARGDYEAAGGSDETAESAGFYAEGRIHLLAGAVAALPRSVFTAVARVDYVDLNRNVDGRDEERLTLGLNFRPTEETVFKNDVLFGRTRAEGDADWSDTETGYRFSVATYF